MKSSLTILALILGLKANAQLNTNVEVIVPNYTYCVHSLLYLNGNLINTSNIYVIRGSSDTCWFFGCGYGDTTDLNIYRDTTLVTSLSRDIRLVDSIVTDVFGMASCKPMVISAHYHLDHLNKDFIDGLDSLFGFMQSKIYCHFTELKRCTCNQLCCTGIMCAQGSISFGAPFDRPWLQSTIAQFKTMGSKNDPCGKILKYITTPLGNWIVKKGDNAHTSGCVNLDHSFLNMRINGSDIVGACVAPGGWQVFPIHGDCF